MAHGYLLQFLLKDVNIESQHVLCLVDVQICIYARMLLTLKKICALVNLVLAKHFCSNSCALYELPALSFWHEKSILIHVLIPNGNLLPYFAAEKEDLD